MYQLVSISIVFWNFDSYLIREVETPDNFPLPGITLCFDKIILFLSSESDSYLKSVQQDKLYKMYTNQLITSMNDRKKMFLLMNYLPISVQHEITKSSHEMKFTCFLESLGLIQCDEIFTLIPYLTFTEKCFHFKSKQTSHQFVRQIVPRHGQLQINFIKPRLQPGLSYVKIAISSPQSSVPIWTSSSHWYSINYKNHDSVDLSYTITRKEYLPSPYKTNCSSDASNQCVHKCLNDDFPAQTNRWHPNVPGLLDNQYLFMFKDDNINNHYQNDYLTDKINTINVLKECEKGCEKAMPCFREEYHALLVSKNVETIQSYFQISVSPPDGILLETLKPKITIPEFICYIGSATGLWLGLSLYHVMSHFDVRKYMQHPSYSDQINFDPPKRALSVMQISFFHD